MRPMDLDTPRQLYEHSQHAAAARYADRAIYGLYADGWDVNRGICTGVEWHTY